MFSSAHIVALFLSSTALAQRNLPIELDYESQQVESVPSVDSVAFTFTGMVLAPDGKPDVGAVVVSSAGGQAVTDSDGKFLLDVQVPRAAKSIQITAIGRSDGELLAHKQVQLRAPSGVANVGSLELVESSFCSPSWLPTFGQAPGTNGLINALAVFDDGSGEALFAGGEFLTAGGI